MNAPRLGNTSRVVERHADAWRVTLCDLDIDDDDVEAVSDVVRSRWLSSGPVTGQFEADWARLLEVPQTVAVSSGTAALHLAMLALGIGPGDEVIVPSMTFVASAAVVALTGARPVFADITSLRNPEIDPADVARRIGSRTAAIVATHYAGYPAPAEELVALAGRHGLAVVEDAAHAPGVRAGDSMLGTVGDIGCFSFFATKNVTTGEGGLVVSTDADLLQRVRLLRSHGMTTSSWDKQQGRASQHDVVAFGLNYRLTDIAAALGRSQLRKLPRDRAHRRALTARYHSGLAALGPVIVPFLGHPGDSAFHLMAVLLPDREVRDAVQRRLREVGIQTSVHYQPTHLFSCYRERYGTVPGQLPVTEEFGDRELTLPLHVGMTMSDVDLVVAQVVEALGKEAVA